MGPLPQQYEVLFCDQSADAAVLVDQGELFHPSLEKDPLGLFRADIRRTGHEPLHRRHELLDAALFISGRPRHIAIGEQPREDVASAGFFYEYPGDVVHAGEQPRFADGRIAREA